MTINQCGSGQHTKRPKDWKEFLTNDDNKQQLVQVLLSTLASDSSATLIDGHTIILICEGEASELTAYGANTSSVLHICQRKRISVRLY